MLSPTLSEGLKAYRIGEKLRRLRLKRKMGLVQLGQHTGLSPALLSKLENGKLFPTLPTLLRIAMVFSVDLEHFFKADEPTLAVVRAKDRISLPERPGQEETSYRFESLDFPAVEKKLNAYYVEFQPRQLDEARRHQHEGTEFIYIISGTLNLIVGDEENVLRAHDSAYFDSSVAHGYQGLSRAPCKVILVSMPD